MLFYQAAFCIFFVIKLHVVTVTDEITPMQETSKHITGEHVCLSHRPRPFPFSMGAVAGQEPITCWS